MINTVYTDETFSAQGKGKSKKEAKHEASRLLFKLISSEEEGKENAEYVTDQL
jgi:dsRNA-specific ribonuclease